MFLRLIYFVSLFISQLYSFEPCQNYTITDTTKQLIVVTTKTWETNRAYLTLYQKKNQKWEKTKLHFPVMIGRNGLGFGRGECQYNDAPFVKKEGDGKAPAGIFKITQLFGQTPQNSLFTYKLMNESHHCVDDSNSLFYNQIVESSKISEDYNSFEVMKRQDHQYQHGFFVAHNRDALKDAGSCIFLHIKKNEFSPTVGCTAMSKKEIEILISILDPQKNPLLIQLPKKLWHDWGKRILGE
jgi:L,D-peptidoglycan transpeptidase YkuD (ErfK/YbiS/YcfS/YnhG family)